MAGKRGQYNPKRKETPQPEPTVDAIQNQNIALVPDLNLRSSVSAEGLTLAFVGTKTGEANTKR